MSAITANFVVNQIQSGFNITQSKIEFQPEPIQLRLAFGTNQIGTPNGPNGSIQFNDSGNLNGSANFLFNKVTNNVTIGTGTGGNLIGANLVSANLFTGTLTTAAQPNVTSLGTLTGLTVSNLGSVNGITVQGGSNLGAHVSTFTNNLLGDNGIQFTIYGNSYPAGSWFAVGANGSAITANTASPFGIGTATTQPLLFGTNGAEKARVTTGGSLAVNTQTARGNVSIGTDTTGSEQSHTLHFGYTPADYYGFRFNNVNNPANTAAGNLILERGNTLAWANIISVQNLGAVTVHTPASGNALTVQGNVVANGLASPTSASAATDTTITHKFPIVLNGVTYWIALTTNQ